MSGKTNIVKVSIVGDEKSLNKAAKAASADLGKVGKDSDSLGSKVGKFASKFTAALGGGVIAGVGLAVKGGAQLQESQDQLRVSVEDTGGSWSAYDRQLAPLYKSGEKLNFTNQDINEGLAALTTATGSSVKGIQLLGVTQDLAAKKGIPLKDAAIAVAKASEGQLKPLKQLGIDLPIAAGGAVKVAAAEQKLTLAHNAVKLVEAAIHAGRLKGKPATDALAKANFGLMAAQDAYNKAGSAGGGILAALASRIDGSASTAADSFQGKVKNLHVRFQDFTAHLGVKLIPILITLGDKFSGLVDWFGKNKIALDALVIVVGAFIAGMVGMAIVEKVQGLISGLKAAWAGLNVVMDANPIVLITLGLAALVAGVIIAYNKVGWFRTGVQVAFKAITGAVTGTFDWVKAHWPLLLAILTGPIGAAVLVIHSHWSAITGGFRNVVSGIQSGVNSIVGFIEGLPGRISGAATSFGSTLLHGILNGIGSAASAVGSFVEQIGNGLKSLIDKYIIDPIRGIHIHWGGFHGIGAFDIHPFDFLPRLHTGGIFNSGNGEGLALLEDNEGVFTPAQMRAMGMLANGGGNRQSGDFIVHMPAGIDPSAVAAAMRRHAKRNGL